MSKTEDTGSPGYGWSASYFMQTTEDVARAVAAAMNSSRPSSVYSLKNENSGSQLQKLQRRVSSVLKGFSQSPEVKVRNYNPEVLTSQKRQWANFQLQYLDQRSLKEPSRLFESMVVLGLHPDCDIQALRSQYITRRPEGSHKLPGVDPNIEPQVLFVYPPEKQLPLKHKDLLSFCFPGGVEVNAVERTPSMSELNEILLSQEHLNQSDLSFVFRLQVADDSTLYGCCVLVDEIVQKPSGLLSMVSDRPPAYRPKSRHILTTRRCYCILSRLPFFEMHFGILNSIFNEERLERLRRSMGDLDFGISDDCDGEENLSDESLNDEVLENTPNSTAEASRFSFEDSNPLQSEEDHSEKASDHSAVVPVDLETEIMTEKRESNYASSEVCDVDGYSPNKQTAERHFPNAVLPLFRYHYESSESSYSFQGSPCEDRNFRSDIDDTETEETSTSGQEDNTDYVDILEWAKANNHGTLRILSEYYRLPCPSRGSTVYFQPLEHLHPLEYHRPDVSSLRIAGSTIDLKSCSTSLEFAEAHNAVLVEEEATALSTWAVACMCGSFRLEHVLTIFAAALLEKQIVVFCSNLGILSATILAIIPLIRPYQYQSLLMPVLPDDMLDFLDAPVPYIVGVNNKTSEIQSKLTNVVLVDANKNQVKSPTIPQLPKQKQLYASLSPYHSKIVGESYMGRKRPVYECTGEQIEAAKGFLQVLRSYVDSLCSNMRSHTITNVQSNNDKVSLLLKESFIESFPSRDRAFMKLFVDTQLFSVHTDLILSFYQKE